MSLLKTNLKIVAAQLPPDFAGTTAELYRAFVERLEILSPVGTNFFVVGSVEPPSDQGPWLKDGTAWWVFDTSLGRYVPADISASTTSLFTVSESTPPDPTTGSANIWLRLKTNRVLGWYFWDGAAWRPEGHTPASGPTADRPSDPGDLEQFFDTDIACLIHWERNAWRTVSGTPGDIKFVTDTVLSQAITKNPGWIYLGENAQSLRGTVLGLATHDSSGPAAYPSNSGQSARTAGSYAGTETVTLADLEIPQHTHIVGTLKVYSTAATQNAYLFQEESGDNLTYSGPAVSRRLYTAAWARGEAAPAPVPNPGAANCHFITSKQLTAAAIPQVATTAPYVGSANSHANVQPTSFLWALQKT